MTRRRSAGAGLIGPATVLILAGFLGTLGGRLILDRLSDHGFRRVLDVVLILISIRLIWTGLSSLL
mgnify:CR=1 FL=1